MFDVCTTGGTEYTLIQYSSSCHTRVNMGASIFLYAHTLASPSGRIVNYDDKQLSGKKIRVPSVCTDFVNTCPTAFLSYIFVIPEYSMKRPV
jgi:hypothetical protein